MPQECIGGIIFSKKDARETGCPHAENHFASLAYTLYKNELEKEHLAVGESDMSA